MIMIPGSGTISNYGAYISNCQLRQMNYKIPVNSLSDVQLYINIGTTAPGTVLYQLIHTCDSAGTIETLSTSSYVVGQDTNNNWYGVFSNLTGGTNLSCFVIAITLDDQIYFSEEYCVENSCSTLSLLKGCYGNLDNKLSYDCEGVYFGTHAGTDTALGDTTIVYKHELLLRGVEVGLSAIKNSFKQGRTRNFRTEKEKIFQFWGEPVPEWYIPEVDSIFYRGEVYVDEVKYLVNETQFEKVEECFKTWKPTATFKESCYKSFSCEADPCLPPSEQPTECCDPFGVTATVQSGVCCVPTGVSATVSTIPLGDFILELELNPSSGDGNLTTSLTANFSFGSETGYIDWGDGSALEPFVVIGTNHEFTHTYASAAIYTQKFYFDNNYLTDINNTTGLGIAALYSMNATANMTAFTQALLSGVLVIDDVLVSTVTDYILTGNTGTPVTTQTSFDASVLPGLVTKISLTFFEALTTITNMPVINTVKLLFNSVLANINLVGSFGAAIIEVQGNGTPLNFGALNLSTTSSCIIKGDLSTSDVNAILVALDGNGINGGSCDVRQTPVAAPSGGGATAKTNLIGKGWTVLTD